MRNKAKGEPRLYYTVSEAARILAVSPSTVWRWIEAGKLAAFRVGARTIRIRHEDLDSIVRPARAREDTIDKERTQMVPVSEEEVGRRKALVAQILSKRQERVITPLTTADLVRKVREEERGSHGS